VVVPRKHLKELYSAPEEHISFATAITESLQLEHTFQKNIAVNHYHTIVVKAELTRHISEKMSDIVDELGAAMEDEIPIDSVVDWTPICSFEKTMNIVARISNRMFVGLPLCIASTNFSYVGRNKRYLQHVVQHAATVVKAAIVLRIVPRILKPYVSLLIL
jgi:hypothetical protein